MQKISKDERDYLINECGFKPVIHVSRTYTHHPHYYVTEYDSVMKALNEYREKTRN